MGSPSPGTAKLKKQTSVTKVGPHRRAPSITSLSLESVDKDVQSPTKISVPGRSPATNASPKSPAGSLGEKSPSPAARDAARTSRRRSSFGGADDLARGLDFSTASPPVEEKKHPFLLARGGGSKNAVRPASSSAQANSPGKKTSTTPPGKEKLVGRVTSTSTLSPKKSDLSKKAISSPRRSISRSEVLSINGIKNSRAELGTSLDADFPIEEATSTSDKSSPRVSLDGKTGKSSPRSTLKFRSDLTSAKGRKLVNSTPSPPQLGRLRRQIDKGPRYEELSKPELEAVEVPVYSENEFKKVMTSEDVDDTLPKLPESTEHGGACENSSMPLESMVVPRHAGDEVMSSFEDGNDPCFSNGDELPTSWLSEDLPSMFSSLSHPSEPHDPGLSLLGDPPEVLHEALSRGAAEEYGSTDKNHVQEAKEDHKNDSCSASLDQSSSEDTAVSVVGFCSKAADFSDVDAPNLHNDLSTEMTMAGARRDTGDIVSEVVKSSPEAASSVEELYPDVTTSLKAKSGTDSPEMQMNGACKPAHLDQNKIAIEELRIHRPPNEFSLSDAGQSDAKHFPRSSISETQTLKLDKCGVEGSLPPIQLPESIFPIVGQLHTTLLEAAPTKSPSQSRTQSDATKLLITDLLQEIPRESVESGLPCLNIPTSSPAWADPQINTDTEDVLKDALKDAAMQKVCSAEVSNVVNGSCEISTFASADSLCSPSSSCVSSGLCDKPLILSESSQKVLIECAGGPESSQSLGLIPPSLGTEHYDIADVTQLTPSFQISRVEEHRDANGVLECQEPPALPFSVQDTSASLMPPEEVSSNMISEDLYISQTAETEGGFNHKAPLLEELAKTPRSPNLSPSVRGSILQNENDDKALDGVVISVPRMEDSYLSPVAAIAEFDIHEDISVKPVADANLESDGTSEMSLKATSLQKGMDVNCFDRRTEDAVGTDAAKDVGSVDIEKVFWDKFPVGVCEVSREHEKTFNKIAAAEAKDDQTDAVFSDDVLIKTGESKTYGQEAAETDAAAKLDDIKQVVIAYFPVETDGSSQQLEEAATAANNGEVQELSKELSLKASDLCQPAEEALDTDGAAAGESGDIKKEILNGVSAAAGASVSGHSHESELVADTDALSPDATIDRISKELSIETGGSSQHIEETDDIDEGGNAQTDDAKKVVSNEYLSQEYSHGLHEDVLASPDHVGTARMDGSRDPCLEISPDLRMVDARQKLSASYRAGAHDDAALEGVDSQDFSFSEQYTSGGKNTTEEELTEANFLSSLENEDESHYEATNTGGDLNNTVTIGKSIRQVEDTFPEDESQNDLDQVQDAETQQSIPNSLEQCAIAKDNFHCKPGGHFLLHPSNSRASFHKSSSEKGDRRPERAGYDPFELQGRAILPTEAKQTAVELVVESANNRSVVGNGTIIPAFEVSTNLNHALKGSLVKLLQEPEEGQIVVENVVECAIGLSDKSVLEKHGPFDGANTGFEMDGEPAIEANTKWKSVDLKEHSRGEQGWGDQLLAAEASGAKSSPEDTRDATAEEPSFSCASFSNVTESETAEDLLEIDLNKDEKTLRREPTPYRLDNLEKYPVQEIQDSHLHLAASSPSTAEHISSTAAVLETENILTTSLNSAPDQNVSSMDIDIHPTNGSPIISETCNVRASSFTKSSEDPSHGNPKPAVLYADEVEKSLILPPTVDQTGDSFIGSADGGSFVENDDRVDTPRGNMKGESVSVTVANEEVDMASRNFDSELACHSGGAMTSNTSAIKDQDVDALHVSTHAAKAILEPSVIETDLGDGGSGSITTGDVTLLRKSSVNVDSNGKELHKYHGAHGLVASDQKPSLVVEQLVTHTPLTSITSQEFPAQYSELHSPKPTLNPILGEPPFSSSQQDRLWEEQAEAYSSGGRGTPTRNDDASQATFHPPSPGGAASSDDQIQPASGPLNNDHAMGRASNGGENGGAHEAKGNGKGKPHTPLRSLLLEDVPKGTDEDPSGPSSATNSPSFIRRLFRVMSTPSRTTEKEVSHTKLKKSSSMWVSCLGMPQVQQ